MSTYYVDGTPLDWRELIAYAQRVDPSFGQNELPTTSRAVVVLRDHDYAVSDKPPQMES
jgi:hypothetical protein